MLGAEKKIKVNKTILGGFYLLVEKAGTYMGNGIDTWGSGSEERNIEYKMAELELHLFISLTQQIVWR